MPPLITARINLRCCSNQQEISFDHDDTPILPPNMFRKNLICPACDRLLIITLQEHPDGRLEIDQELI